MDIYGAINPNLPHTFMTEANYHIPGLNTAHLELLQASGINSAQDLAKNHPGKLLRWMEEVNAERRIVRRMPSLDVVSDWVDKARTATP
jgi:hypothetical protein